MVGSALKVQQFGIFNSQLREERLPSSVDN